MARFKLEVAEEQRDRLYIVTRDGREVRRWWVVDTPEDTFFPVRAEIVQPNGWVEVMPFTRNGRRYINIESGEDLMMRAPSVHARPDCMPDVMRAIECAKRRDSHGVRSANKEGNTWSSSEVGKYDTSGLYSWNDAGLCENMA